MTCQRCGAEGHAAGEHCDLCGRLIRSKQQLEAYDALGVDWAICKRCERRDL